ncbi:hypothetical protein IG631_04941 [Alternaria alternata]|nr:hypothetical protein IG631_04941 [Alternaria alternata]
MAVVGLLAVSLAPRVLAAASITRAEFSLSSSSSSSPCVGPYGRDRPQDAALDPRNYGSWTGPYLRANNLGTLTLLRLCAERVSPTLSDPRHLSTMLIRAICYIRQRRAVGFLCQSPSLNLHSACRCTSRPKASSIK